MKHISIMTKQARTAIEAGLRWATLRVVAAMLIASAALTQVAFAQDKYPNRPIRFVVAFAPGGITDIIARLFGERMSEKLGQTIIIDNKGGAAGALGAKLVSSSEPDGYTFLVTTTAVAVGAAASPTNVDPRTKLVPIALAASSPTVISAKASTNAKNLKEFASELKQPTLAYASSGAGTVEHLTAAYVLKGLSGVDATHVPYRSGGEAVNAVIGSHVNLSTTPTGSAMSFVQSQQLKILGIATRKRMPMLPDVPTFGESGLADIESASWVAIFGPPGLPVTIAQRINAEVNNTMREPALRERLTKMGFDLRESSQQEFHEQIKTEVVNWQRILKETGITLN